jgi:hypothetical protein
VVETTSAPRECRVSMPTAHTPLHAATTGSTHSVTSDADADAEQEELGVMVKELTQQQDFRPRSADGMRYTGDVAFSGLCWVGVGAERPFRVQGWAPKGAQTWARWCFLEHELTEAMQRQVDSRSMPGSFATNARRLLDGNNEGMTSRQHLDSLTEQDADAEAETENPMPDMGWPKDRAAVAEYYASGQLRRPAEEMAAEMEALSAADDDADVRHLEQQKTTSATGGASCDDAPPPPPPPPPQQQPHMEERQAALRERQEELQRKYAKLAKTQAALALELQQMDVELGVVAPAAPTPQLPPPPPWQPHPRASPRRATDEGQRPDVKPARAQARRTAGESNTQRRSAAPQGTNGAEQGLESASPAQGLDQDMARAMAAWRERRKAGYVPMPADARFQIDWAPRNV